MQETAWSRSVYLYVMTLVSIALIGFGAVGIVVGVVHAIAPDLGHRDTLDRVGIGAANVGEDIVDLVSGASGDGDIEDFCRDVTDNEDDFDDCVELESATEDVDAIKDGIGEIRSGLQTQIRNSSIEQVIRGLLGLIVGILLFWIHGTRTELFANGVFPARRKKSPPQDAEPAASPVPTAAAPTRHVASARLFGLEGGLRVRE